MLPHLCGGNSRLYVPFSVRHKIAHAASDHICKNRSSLEVNMMSVADAMSALQEGGQRSSLKAKCALGQRARSVSVVVRVSETGRQALAKDAQRDESAIVVLGSQSSFAAWS